MSRELLLGLARTGMSLKQTSDQASIRTLVGNLAQLPMFVPPLELQDLEAIAKQLEREFMVDLGPAHTIAADDHVPWLSAKRHEIEFKYWRRYKEHLSQSGFGIRVVNRLDEVTDNILDLAGDPSLVGSWRRRGLVVGHVQSGKTANYVGLINKAADAGYKLIILIAGIHSNLRSQTQERIDEGFVGRDSDQLLGRVPNANFIGVGNIDRSFHAVAYTSRANDFLRPRADGLGVSINNLSQPAIFVIKKQKAILSNLIEWLRGTSASGDKLAMPMLVIDDEADNASVNTSADADRPNTINGLIRSLLSISTRNTYIGYTATPFANIFIDPETEDDLRGEDLFPKDFIVGLDAPSNYVGANEFFVHEETSNQLVRVVDESDDWLPPSHKIDAHPVDLHDTLKEAIQCFVLSKAIRILRQQGERHHSMLVNVSRFTNVQNRVSRLISDYVAVLRESIENKYAMATSSALRDPVMKAVYDTWSRVYAGNTSETWEAIQGALHQAASGVKVVEINSSSGPGSLDYRSHRYTGLTVIAVGGNSLSRGFTLEGLVVSYFLRNTQMYDTLLQMGRWFGFRDGFKDLCRLFVKEDARSWYSYIAEATEELRQEIRRMEHSGLTPMDFGLMVRSHPDSLLVTAKNKMRTAESVVRQVGLSGKMVESSVLHSANGPATSNVARTKDFVQHLVESSHEVSTFPRSATSARASRVFHGVESAKVIDFIRGFAVHEGNADLATKPLTDFIERKGFAEWDVLLVSNSRVDDESKVAHLSGIEVGLQERGAELRGVAGRSAIVVAGNKRRVASRGIEAAGLTEEQVALAHAAAAADRVDAKNISDHHFRAQRVRPLLMLHLLNVTLDKVSSGDIAMHAAFGVSFPGLRKGEVESRVEYVANVIAYAELFGRPGVDDDDGEVDGQ